MEPSITLIIILFSFFLCSQIHVILHELGHLVFGLIQKYEFIAFGWGGYGFIREDGRIKLRNYEIRGAGGYCIMTPPKPKNHKIPYFWYLSGGLIFNFLSTVIFLLIIVFVHLNGVIYLFSMVFILIGLYLGIINTLPLKISGGTDGCKILAIYKNDQVQEYLYNSYRIRTDISKDIRMKDTPQNLFILPDNANFNNPIFAGIKYSEAYKYFDNGEYDKAEETYKSLISENIKLTNVLRNEVLCQILYFEIIKGNEEEVAKLMTKKLKKYIKSAKRDISKKRLMYAYTVLIEKDVEESESIWYDFHDACEYNLSKAEVESESEIMDYIGKIGIEKGIL